MDLADTISTSSLCLSDQKKATSSSKSGNAHFGGQNDEKNNADNKTEVSDEEKQFDEFSVKKNPGLAISANEWCERVRQTCSDERGNDGILTLAKWLPVLLCLYSILKEIKVGEPFLFKYQTDYLNFTDEQVRSEVKFLTNFKNDISFYIYN